MLVLHWKQDASCLLLQLVVILWGALLATPQIPAVHKAHGKSASYPAMPELCSQLSSKASGQTTLSQKRQPQMCLTISAS